MTTAIIRGINSAMGLLNKENTLRGNIHMPELPR
jgi:hypothetical protein